MEPAPGLRWRELLTAALAVLDGHERVVVDLLGSAVSVVVPLLQRDGRLVGRPRFEIESGSVSTAVGAVFLSPGDWDPRQFAEALVHEAHHQLLNAALMAFDFVGDHEAEMASPWKPGPRPASALLHGIVAFSAVRRFWIQEALRGGGTYGEIDRRGVQVLEAAEVVLGSRALTDLGVELVEEAVSAVLKQE